MAEVGSIVVNARMQTAEFSRGSKKVREEMAAIQRQIETGQRSLRVFYQTQARAAERGFVEQQVRDEMAARIKAMRAAVLDKSIQEEASRRLFGAIPVEEAAKEGSKAGEAAGEGFLNSLKRTLGGRSTTKDVIEIFRGAGPIAAVALGARAIREVAEGAEKIRATIADASKTWGDVFDTSLKSLPIISDLYQGFLALNPEVRKRAQEEQRTLFIMQQQLAVALRQRNAMRDLRSFINETGRIRDEFEDEIVLDRAAPADRAKVAIDNRFFADLRALQQERERLLESARPEDRQRVEEQISNRFAELARQHRERLNIETENQMRLARQEELEHIERVRGERLKTVEQEMKSRRQEEHRRIENTKREADAIKRTLMSPAEILREELARIERLESLGFLTEDEAGRAKRKALRDSREDDEQPEGRERRFTFRTPLVARDPSIDELRKQTSALEQIQANTSALSGIEGAQILTLDE